MSAAFGFFEAKEKKEMYLHLDISVADVGYQREIHHDNDNRIAAMVFYLTDQNDMVGGEFGIHEYKIKRPLSECEPHPAAEQMKATKIFQPARNTLIFSLNTKFISQCSADHRRICFTKIHLWWNYYKKKELGPMLFPLGEE